MASSAYREQHKRFSPKENRVPQFGMTQNKYTLALIQFKSYRTLSFTSCECSFSLRTANRMTNVAVRAIFALYARPRRYVVVTCFRVV